jgi:hypothetical protein
MHKQGKLWGVWLAPAIGALIVLCFAQVALERTPASARQELLLDVEELHSQVAEARLLAERGQRGDLTTTFMREHARQLERHLRDTLREARAKKAEVAAPITTGDVAALGEQSASSLHVLADEAEPAALHEAAARLAATSEALARIERALRRNAP